MPGRLYNHFIHAYRPVTMDWPVIKSEITAVEHRIRANDFINELIRLIRDPNPQLFEALHHRDPALRTSPLGETLAKTIWERRGEGQLLVEKGVETSFLPPKLIQLVYRDMVKRALLSNLVDIQAEATRNQLPLSVFLTNQALAEYLVFVNQETRQLFNDLKKSSSSSAQVLYELSKLATKYLIGLGVIIVSVIYNIYMTNYLKNFEDDMKHPVSGIEYYISFIPRLVLLPFLIASIIAPTYMLYQYSREISVETVIFANTLINWATGVSERKLKAELKTDKRLFLELPMNVPEEVKTLVKTLEAPVPNLVETRLDIH